MDGDDDVGRPQALYLGVPTNDRKRSGHGKMTWKKQRLIFDLARPTGGKYGVLCSSSWHKLFRAKYEAKFAAFS